MTFDQTEEAARRESYSRDQIAFEKMKEAKIL